MTLLEWLTSTEPCTPLPTTLSWSAAKEFQQVISVRARRCLWCRQLLNPPEVPPKQCRRSTAVACCNSHRALLRNPSADPGTRAQISQTLRRMGHRPTVRGGNGTGLTEAQTTLLHSLGLGWLPEHVVSTGARVKGGPPTHYKIDLAHPERMVAVEIDGGSHGTLARQRADQRKTAWLSLHGWSVLRFSNQEVLSSTASVTRQILSTPLRLTRSRTPTSPLES